MGKNETPFYTKDGATKGVAAVATFAGSPITVPNVLLTAGAEGAKVFGLSVSQTAFSSISSLGTNTCSYSLVMNDGADQVLFKKSIVTDFPTDLVFGTDLWALVKTRKDGDGNNVLVLPALATLRFDIHLAASMSNPTTITVPLIIHAENF